MTWVRSGTELEGDPQRVPTRAQPRRFETVITGDNAWSGERAGARDGERVPLARVLGLGQLT